MSWIHIDFFLSMDKSDKRKDRVNKWMKMRDSAYRIYKTASFLLLLISFLAYNQSFGQTTDVFNASGNWTAPLGVTSVTVECWGAGAGGGGGNVAALGSGGGGGGAYSYTANIPVTPGNIYPVTVGTGGALGNKNPGGNGGDSYFIDNSTYILAKGGLGGEESQGATPGTGGAGGSSASCIGDFNYSGGDGASGDNSSNGGGGGSSAGTAADGASGGLSTGATAPSGGGNGGNGGAGAAGSVGLTPGGGGGAGGGKNDGGTGAAGRVSITYTASNDKCPSSNEIAPLATQTLCQGDASTLLTSTITLSGSSGTPTELYQWYYNTSNSNTVSGATKISGATSQTYTPLTTVSEVGDRWYFCVGYATNNNCAQTDADQSLASSAVQVTVNAIPATPTITPDGATTFCAGGSVNLTSSATTGTYLWSTAETTPAINVTTGNSYTVTITENGCTSASSAAEVVIVNPIPAKPTIAAGGATTFCSPGSVTLTSSATTGTYLWSTAETSPSIIVSTAGSYTVSVTESGCTSPVSDATTVTVNNIATTGAISGPVTVTASMAGLIYSITPVGDETDYTWTVPGNPGSWTITAGQGTNSITVTSGTKDGDDITVFATNVCGDDPSPSVLTVGIGVAPDCPTSSAVTPNGVQTVCEGVGTSQLSDAISSSGGSGTYSALYQWYYNTSNSNTVTGATTIGGATGSAYTPLSTSTEVGDRWYFCVGYATDNTCAQTNADQSLASNAVQITVNPLAGTLTAITGSANATPNTGGYIYSTTSTNADANGYTWILPTGWTQTAGGTSNSITVTSGADGQNGNIEVTSSNGCGTSSATIKAVTSSVAASPPTITLGANPVVCKGTTSANLTYSATTNSPDKYSIDWNATAEGQGFLDVPVTTNLPASPIVLTVPGGAAKGTYNGTLVVKNEGTALSSGNYAISVTVNDVPSTPTISGQVTPGPSLVGYVYTVPNVVDATNYTWTVPAGWNIDSGQGTNTLTATSGALTEDGNITATVTNACGTSSAGTLSVTVTTLVDHSTISCASCHTFHNATGNALTNNASNSGLCTSCHNPAAGSMAENKPFLNADKAIPGTGGNSHSWDVAIGLYETNLPSDSEMSLRLTAANEIVCSTCHNQHNNGALGSPYLRMDNTDDAMCKDCHSVRDVGNFAGGGMGSHPVNVTYDDTDSRFKNTQTLVTNGNKVQCSTCHGVHDVTNSGTLTTDGYLLKATNDETLCTDCHVDMTHNGMTCKDCHQTHNPDKTNIYMIKSTIATPNSGDKTVAYATSGLGADGDATYDGICEVCHTSTTYHQNNGGGDHAHNVGTSCTDCHLHDASFAGGDCVTCHQTNYATWQISDAHVAHTTKYNFACSTCHFERGSGTAFHEDATADVNFDPNGMATRNGKDVAVAWSPPSPPAYDSGTKTCTNVYCHSDGRTAVRGTFDAQDTLTWGGTANDNGTYASPVWDTGSITDCYACHSGVGIMTAPYTIDEATFASTDPDPPSTGKHTSAAHAGNSQEYNNIIWEPNVQCFWCHNTNGGNIESTGMNQGTYGTSYHVDGETYFDPRSVADGGTMVNGTQTSGGSFSYSKYGSDTHCGDGKQCWP